MAQQIYKLVSVRTLAPYCCLLLATVELVVAQQDQGEAGKFLAQTPGDNTIHTCKTDELNHSVLVECSAIGCSSTTITSSHKVDWPTSPEEVIHIYSSRAGARFAQVKLPNLNFTEDYDARMLNINTTLYVETTSRGSGPAEPSKTQQQQQQQQQRGLLLGIGATLNPGELATAFERDEFERSYGLVLDDLLGRTSSSAYLNLMRFRVGPDFVELHNLTALLLKLDEQSRHYYSEPGEKFKLVLDLDNFEDPTEPIRLLSSAASSLDNIEIWAISISPNVAHAIVDRIHQALPRALLLASTPILGAPGLIARIKSGQIPEADFQGFLLQSQPSVPYNILEGVRLEMGPEFVLLTVGQARPMTRDYGDWQNAQESAIELLNHLKYGANGYIEDLSMLEVLQHKTTGDSRTGDVSLYSLHRNHGLHFKGPKFYATGHFSRFLTSGSQPLELDLFTQPNMFAAHYSAFRSADGDYVVGVILNSNEHLLPFRLALEDNIVVFTYLEPKSFNTFLINVVT